jgi:hypothetical protein
MLTLIDTHRLSLAKRQANATEAIADIIQNRGFHETVLIFSSGRLVKY